MKLSHKISKLAEPLTYRRAWRRAQRSIFPLPVEPLAASIDQDRLREIQRRYAGSSSDYAKYANVDRWLRINRNRVQDLKLHRSPPKHVLDLGCGGGFFLFILKSLGHSVLGLDLDQFPLFTELLDLFGVERVVWRIKALEPLPDLDQKFDWITAFSINFNLHYPASRLSRCAPIMISWTRRPVSFLISASCAAVLSMIGDILATCSGVNFSSVRSLSRILTPISPG